MQHLIPTIKEFLPTKLSTLEFVDVEISDESSDDFDIFEVHANLPSQEQASAFLMLGLDPAKAITEGICTEIFHYFNGAIVWKLADKAVKSYEDINAGDFEQLRETLHLIASDAGEQPNNVIIAAPELAALNNHEVKLDAIHHDLLFKQGTCQFKAENDEEFNVAFYGDYNRCGEQYNAIFVNYGEPVKLNVGKIELATSDDGNSQIVRVAYQIDLGDASITKAHIDAAM